MKALSLVSVAVLVLGLAACDRGPSAVAQGSASGSAERVTVRANRATIAARGPVPRINGVPMWAANRRHTAQENAAFQFGKNGAALGAANVEDYVARAHAFAASPPAGAQRITRPNGDTLIYDAASNVFAVVDPDGAPRTLFKPRDGAAYWTAQQARATASADGSDSTDS